MLKYYFLGANTSRGFYSLYDSFAAEKGDVLHIIKGCPGGGKSGFMRKIAEAAEAAGLSVSRLLCSGDPDSLDGIYIPALRQGWVDGTAPHALEPRCFGVDSDYVDLSAFCTLPLSRESAERVVKLSREYKAEYARAYAFLAAAAEHRQAAALPLWDGDRLNSAKQRIQGILRRSAAKRPSGKAKRESCFLSAISCKGFIRLKEEISRSCPMIYELDNRYLGAWPLLEYALATAEEMGFGTVRLCDALKPEKTEGILLPDAGVALLAGDWGFEEARHMRLDNLAEESIGKENRSLMRAAGRMYRSSMELAEERLKAAKQLHDGLEREYGAAMDFDALTEFTDKQIRRLFG